MANPLSANQDEGKGWVIFLDGHRKVLLLLGFFFALTDIVDTDLEVIPDHNAMNRCIFENITAQFVQVAGEGLAEGDIDEQIDAVTGAAKFDLDLTHRISPSCSSMKRGSSG